MRKRTAMTIIVLTGLLGACAHISGKTVAAKNAPNMLVANDGSICVVSKDRFEKTEVGMKALCAWKGGRIPDGRMQSPYVNTGNSTQSD